MKHIIEKIIDELALNFTMRFPGGIYDENDPNIKQYLDDAIISLGLRNVIDSESFLNKNIKNIENNHTNPLEESTDVVFDENEYDFLLKEYFREVKTIWYESVAVAGIHLNESEGNFISDFLKQNLNIKSNKGTKSVQNEVCEILHKSISYIKNGFESAKKKGHTFDITEKLNDLLSQFYYKNSDESLKKISVQTWIDTFDILKIAHGAYVFKKEQIKNILTNDFYLIHSTIDTKFKKKEMEIGYAKVDAKSNTSDILLCSVIEDKLLNYMDGVMTSGYEIIGYPNENPTHVIIKDMDKILCKYVQISLKKGESSAQLGKFGKFISNLPGTETIGKTLSYFDIDNRNELINRIEFLKTKNRNKKEDLEFKNKIEYLKRIKKYGNFSKNNENLKEHEFSKNSIVYETFLENVGKDCNEILDESVLDDLADIGRKVYSLGKDFTKSLILKFNTIMLSKKNSIIQSIKSSSNISNDDFLKISSEFDNDEKNSIINEKDLGDVTKKQILSISKNYKNVYNSIKNEVFNLEKTLIEINSKNIPVCYHIDISKLEPVPITIGDPERFGDIPTVQAFSLISNINVLRTSINLLKNMMGEYDIKDLIAGIASEMIYGGTLLPIWKVYGSAPGEKSYENLGTYKLLIKNIESSSDRLELFGIKVKYPSMKNPWLVIYWYILYKIDVDENNNISKKHYVIIRTGTNSGSSFTANYEGTSTPLLLNAGDNLLDFIKK